MNTELSDVEYRSLRDLIQERVGIVLGDDRKQMLQARLAKRLRSLGLGSISEYNRLLRLDATGQEMTRFVNAVTTNKTAFFREPHHFEYLRETWVPELLVRSRTTGNRSLRIWSAACSTGEESYSIAITLLEALGAAVRSWQIRILASDVDTDVLATGARGIYPLERLSEIPRELIARHFQEGTGQHQGLACVSPDLRSMLSFNRINFVDPRWPVRPNLDAVVCRNVMIYFDKAAQGVIHRRFHDLLAEDGLLMLGHSENLVGLSDRFTRDGHTIYRKRPPVSEPTQKACVCAHLPSRGNPAQ